jgi:hypothetical protein
MIPKRHARPVVDEMELAEDDIIAEYPVPVSGVYAAVRPRTSAPPPPASTKSAPAWRNNDVEVGVVRLVADSIVDGIETQMNDVTFALARLSVGASTPVLCGPIEWNQLTPPAAWAVSVIAAGFNVEAIIDMSPLPEEKTIALLAQLVATHVITVRS